MIFYAYGTSLLTRDEVRETGAVEKVRQYLQSPRTSPSLKPPFDLINGIFPAETVTAPPAPPAPDGGTPTAAWTPIGLGSPLTIDIREVYTGKYPGGWFGHEHPMLLTSAVKSISTNDAKPRAINFLTRKTGRHGRLSRPKASEQGTPVIFYSPAMVDRSLTVDVAIVFDEFSEPAFQAIGRAFTSAAAVPIFLAHSFYLLAAGEIARIAGSAGEALFDGKPVLDISETIDLELPGASRTAAGFMLVTPADVDTVEPSFRLNYHVSERGVVDEHGQLYAGDIPYVVLSVDGAQRDDLSSFTPTAASAAVLSRFFGVRDGQSLSLDPLLDALKLYNDFTFRSEVDRIDKRLATMTEGPEKTALKQKREALQKNIVTDILKPAP